MVLLEMQFLREIKRVNIGPDEWLEFLRNDFGVSVCAVPLAQVVAEAFKLSWTRDPFDRMILAQAIAGKGKLITRDELIHANFKGAVWK